MAATLPAPILYDPLIHAASILPQIATIHAECILRSGTLASLHPSRNPDTGELAFDPAKVLAYWQPRHDQVLAGQREIILQFTDSTETELAGVVSLHLPTSETGPFRADVEKLLVSPRHRYKGIARRLMQKLEEVARGRGRSLLVRSSTPSSHEQRLVVEPD